MPPLDDRHTPTGVAPARWRPAARGADHAHQQAAWNEAAWTAGHPERDLLSQPRAQAAPAPYPRRYPPESWGAPSTANRVSGHMPRPAPAPAHDPAAQPAVPSPAVNRAVDRADGQAPTGLRAEPPASLIGALPSVAAYAPPPSPDASLRRPASRRADPSPSRLAYRLNRLWLTPLFRRGITMGLPGLVLAGVIALYLGDGERRAATINIASELRAGFEARPEFRVERLAVQADSPELAQAIEDRMDIAFPVSSFHLDLSLLRARIEALDVVESAALHIGSDRVLEVRVIEREPAFVWRHRGGLALIDSEGHRVALPSSRGARADLPLVVGDGAPAAVAEARQLLVAAAPLGEALQALVRVGERRWDLVLDGDRRVMLPANGAVTALERVLALDSAPADLLSRDVTVVDMRNPGRPTIRLSQTAMAELHRIRSLE